MIDTKLTQFLPLATAVSAEITLLIVLSGIVSSIVALGAMQTRLRRLVQRRAFQKFFGLGTERDQRSSGG